MYHLVEAHHLLVVSGVPAEQGEEVDDGFGQITFFAVAAAHFAALRVVPFEWEDREAQFVAVAFAELAVAYGFEQERQVCEAWHCVGPAESFIEKDVERCAGQPFFAANNVCYLHQMVVHNVGEMVGGEFVGTLVENLVVEDAAVYAYFSTNDVVHNDVSSRFDQETNHVLLAFGYKSIDFFFWHYKRVAHLHSCACIVLEVFYFCTFCIQFFGCVKGDVGLSAVEKLLNILFIYVATFALTIWSVIASETHALVELDAKPFERLDDIFFCPRNKTSGVGVFNAEDELTAMLAGKKIVV